MAESANIASEVWNFKISNTRGLHLRFAGEIAKRAMKYKEDVSISDGTQSANAKSALSLLSLAATEGVALSLQVRGDNAVPALANLRHFVENYSEK